MLILPPGDGEGSGVVFEGGYGEDIAVLDTGYFLSQIILSVLMGELVEITAAPQASYSVEKLLLAFWFVLKFLYNYRVTRVRLVNQTRLT